MPFYDQNLNPIPTSSDITWGESQLFATEALISQLTYFLSKVISSDKKVCIIEHVSKIFDSAERINNSAIGLVVINCSDHPLDFADLHVIKKPLVRLGYNFNESDYHPWHLLFSSWLASKEAVDVGSERPIDISCIHGKSRYTRIFNICELSKKPYFDSIYTHWEHMVYNIEDPMHEDGLRGNDVVDCFDSYLELQKSVTNTDQFVTEFDLVANIRKGFSDAYLNVVTEPRISDMGFLTEKVYKPIRAGQLFLYQSAPNTVKFLRDFGFDTFDDYIDHAHYDSEPDWKKRTLLMHQVLDDIQPNIKEIFFKTTDRRQANIDWLKDQRLVTKCLSNIAK